MTDPLAKREGDIGRPVTPDSPAETYARLPWYRRGSTNSGILIVALVILLGGPFVPGLPFGVAGLVMSVLSLVVSVCVLSGPVYYPPKPGDNALREWGVGNKVVAVVFVLIGVLVALRAILE